MVGPGEDLVSGKDWEWGSEGWEWGSSPAHRPLRSWSFSHAELWLWCLFPLCCS